MFSAALFSFCNDNILLFAVSLAQVDITPDGKVTTSVSGVHSGIAARPARGIVSGVREKVADMLNAGMKPIQVESKLAEMDSVVRPLLSQIQVLNKTLKKIYPNMDTLHAAMVALEPFIVDTPEKWATGSQSFRRGGPLTDSRRCGSGRARHRVYEPGRGGQRVTSNGSTGSISSHSH
jgi:hypothetical protein